MIDMNKTQKNPAPEISIHKWEVAFGPAPYRFLGCEEKKYQAIPGDPNCPIQPGGSCDWCGTALYCLFHFISANGTKFVVGCDCAQKSGNAGMKKVVAKEIAAKRKARTAVLNSEKLAKLDALLADEDVRTRLAAAPHPRAASGDFFASQTLLDSVEWMRANAGASGRNRTLKSLVTFLN